MSAYWSTIERPPSPVKPVKRPKGPQAVTFLFTFLQPATFAFLGSIPEQPMHANTRRHPPTPLCKSPPTPAAPPATEAPSLRQMDNIFIDALVQASTCRHHVCRPTIQPSNSRSTYSYHKVRRRGHDTARQIRHLHRNTTQSHRSALSREDYLNLVDLYREPFSTKALETRQESFPPFNDSSAPRARRPSASIADQTVDVFRDDPRRTASTTPLPNESTDVPDHLISQEQLGKLEYSDVVRDGSREEQNVKYLLEILNCDDCTHEAAFEAYSALPSPGVALLSTNDLRLLFRRISTIEKKSRESMLRYLSVVDDMKATDLTMTEAEWNSAIAFCGRCFAIVRSEAVESALRTWKEMEQEAGVKSGGVTFNVLFDIAAKAGKFMLAEMIWKEMEARNLKVNRYARVGLIYYYGLRGDGDGVRNAYREFVEGGEIVDTVVINCVIASLIRAGEPASAEHVYERMKDLLQRQLGPWVLPRYNWKDKRDLGRSLCRAAQQFRYHPIRLQQIKDEQLLAPDFHTYSIFIEHHASRTGELGRITALLTEMKHLGVPMDGLIFLKIFKGFASHGGVRYTSWTKARLESVWNALLDALDEENDVKIMKWMIYWTVKAFERCAGKKRTLEIWDELRRRWEPGGGEVNDLMEVLGDIRNGRSV